MGLFSFVKEAGEKLFGLATSQNSAEQSKMLETHITDLGLSGADKVTVEMASDGTATVTGEGLSQESKEKILVAIGNVAGIAQVYDSLTTEQPGMQSRYYTVKSGDTLGAISKAEYGTANEYQRIFEANKPMLTHPDKIYPGQVLIIPNKP